MPNFTTIKIPTGSRQYAPREAEKETFEALDTCLKSVWGLHETFRFYEAVLKKGEEDEDTVKTSSTLKKEILSKWKRLEAEFRLKSKHMKWPFPQWVETQLENRPDSEFDNLLSVLFEAQDRLLNEKGDNRLQEIMRACKCSIWRLHLHFEYRLLLRTGVAETLIQLLTASAELPYRVLFDAVYKQTASRHHVSLAKIHRGDIMKRDVLNTSTQTVKSRLKIFNTEKKHRDGQRSVISNLPPINGKHDDSQNGTAQSTSKSQPDTSGQGQSTVLDDLDMSAEWDNILASAARMKEQVSDIIDKWTTAANQERQLSLVLETKKRGRDEAWKAFATWTGGSNAEDGVPWNSINSNLEGLKEREADVKRAAEELEESRAKRQRLKERIKPHEDKLDQIMNIMKEIDGAVKASKE
ncbi:hypothetical protein GGR57DRAFT_508821 [Xylariaceae sp. FL1272]|nr:hypothetical protein GGR57DRAFT_508821 [Xylariaceae sp. FL1272]